MKNNCEVLIIGGGPTGIQLGNLLGQLGIKTIIIEKEDELYPIPRATHIDEETLRNFRLTGLMNLLDSHFTPFGKLQLLNPERNVLLTEEVKNENSPHGYLGSCFFDQPAFEKVLREGLKRFPEAEFLNSTEATDLIIEGNSVRVKTKNNLTGKTESIEALYVVGCDGGRSFTREKLGIHMYSLAKKREWLIVDTILKEVTDAKLLPDNFRYFLDSKRLKIYAHGFGMNRRWEFQLEDGEEIPHEPMVTKWLSEFIDPEKLKITRVTRYSHNSLVAQNWKKGKVLLAGDAAHMMPPSAGQGMCSGIRDAVNLAWKLEKIIHQKSNASLLETYESERKPHLETVLRGTIFISERIDARNNFERWWKNLQLKIVGKFPALQTLLRNSVPRTIPFKKGFINEKSDRSGHHFPQFIALKENQKLFSDDMTGYNFSLICNHSELQKEHIERLEKTSIRILSRENDFSYFRKSIENWLAENEIDFAILRPDKIIYSTGKMKDLSGELLNFSVQ